MDTWLVWVAGGAVAFAGWTRWRLRQQLRAARRTREDANQLARRLQDAHRALRREVSLLHAIRDLAIVANDDTSIEPILCAVAQIVERLLGASGLVILLYEDPQRVLAPRVVRREGRTQLGGGDGERLAIELGHCAISEEAIIRQEGPEGTRLATPLPSDREVAGSLVAELSPSADERQIREAERALQAVAKHVALAIQKPVLYDRAVFDQLTGLHTKRHFTGELESHLARCRRTQEPLALLICDLDHFKAVNDRHGHLTGDLVLAEVAATLRGAIRGYDTGFRYGGEELCVIAPKTSLPDALRLAERLRQAVARLELRAPDGQRVPVTASFGVAAFSPALATRERLIAAADRALYRAKADGRNRVVCAGPDGRAPATAAPTSAAVPARPAGSDGAGSDRPAPPPPSRDAPPPRARLASERTPRGAGPVGGEAVQKSSNPA